MSLRSEIKDLYYAISADIEHGECFYDDKMFNSFIRNLEQMRLIAIQLFEKNKEEIEDKLDAELNWD